MVFFKSLNTVLKRFSQSKAFRLNQTQLEHGTVILENTFILTAIFVISITSTASLGDHVFNSLTPIPKHLQGGGSSTTEEGGDWMGQYGDPTGDQDSSGDMDTRTYSG